MMQGKIPITLCGMIGVKCDSNCEHCIREERNAKSERKVRQSLKNLSETAEMMVSADYKERFVAEYVQLAIRTLKLERMLRKYVEGTLSFAPTCPAGVLGQQLEAMKQYLICLEFRAMLEGIELPKVEG